MRGGIAVCRRQEALRSRRRKKRGIRDSRTGFLMNPLLRSLRSLTLFVRLRPRFFRLRNLSAVSYTHLNGGVLSQYQNLIKILQAYRDEDMRTAALIYVDTDMSVLNDGVVNGTVAWIQEDMGTNGSRLLMQICLLYTSRCV